MGNKLVCIKKISLDIVNKTFPDEKLSSIKDYKSEKFKSMVQNLNLYIQYVKAILENKKEQMVFYHNVSSICKIPEYNLDELPEIQRKLNKVTDELNKKSKSGTLTIPFEKILNKPIETDCPEVDCPEVDCPEVDCPEVDCPEVDCPDNASIIEKIQQLSTYKKIIYSMIAVIVLLFIFVILKLVSR